MALITGTTYNLTGLVAGTQYEVEVRAVDTSGNEGPGALSSFTTAGAFTPAALSPYLWMEARQVSTADTAQARQNGTQYYVKQYNDLSGNGRHLAQATDASQPELMNAGTAEAHLYFGAASSTRRLTGAAMQALFEGSFEIGMYLDLFTNISGTQILFECGSPDAGAGFNIFISNNRVVCRFKPTASEPEYRIETALSAFVNKAFYNLKVDKAAKQMTFFRNGVALATINSQTGVMPTADTVTPAITAPLSYMNRIDAAFNNQNEEKALIIIPRVLTDTERANLATYFTY